jgi:hypothetical protein
MGEASMARDGLLENGNSVRATAMGNAGGSAGGSAGGVASMARDGLLENGNSVRATAMGSAGGSTHATELQVVVTATVGGRNFDLLATQKGPTHNYQVQNWRGNRAFFARLKTLGADISYITLQNKVWTQVVGKRTFSLMDKATPYFTSFTLSAAPAPPPKKKK